jgi:hypothetical protein
VISLVFIFGVDSNSEAAALLTDLFEFIELALLFEREESSNTLTGRMFLDTLPEILPS